jgi:hypothetical protein
VRDATTRGREKEESLTASLQSATAAMSLSVNA